MGWGTGILFPRWAAPSVWPSDPWTRQLISGIAGGTEADYWQDPSEYLPDVRKS